MFSAEARALKEGLGPAHRLAVLPARIEDSRPESGPWQEMLYSRMRGRPYPLFIFDNLIIPAASIWSGQRLWLKAFRNAGLVPGDRIVVAVEPSHAFIQVLIAGLWEGYTLCLAPPTDNPHILETWMNALDARAAVAPIMGMPEVFVPQICDGPVEAPIVLRTANLPATPEVRILLRSSGSRSANGGRWIGLSDSNLLGVLRSHLPLLRLSEQQSHVLSILPWHHAFGLVLDLLPALFSGAEIVRDRNDGRDAEGLIRLAQEFAVTHLNSVPIVLQRLLNVSGGPEFLRSLRGGIVGGAAVNRELTEFLRGTRLRAGYGQTEASPGISLGPPGYWPQPGYLGRPVGCVIQQDNEGVLWFAGENACAGYWDTETGMQPAFTRPEARGSWRNTGDVVRIEPGVEDLFFEGRIDDTFKLSNGRRVEAGRLETRIGLLCPQIADSILFSPDGETLTLVWTGEENSGPLNLDDIRHALDELAPRLCSVLFRSVDLWPRSRKGSTDRLELIRQLSFQPI